MGPRFCEPCPHRADWGEVRARPRWCSPPRALGLGEQHMRLMRGEYNASDSAASSVITQMLFTDALVQEAFSRGPLYAVLLSPTR